MQSAAAKEFLNQAIETAAAVEAAGLVPSQLKDLAEFRNKLECLLAPAGNRLALPDFVAHNHDVILDRSTGLYWHKDVSAKTLNEDGEKAYIADLNARTVGGFTDWTCPTRRQLITLINDEAHEPATFEPFKKSTKTSDWYRTSTPLSADPGDRWFVLFNHGDVGYLHRSDGGFVRAVRVASPGQ